MFDTINRPHPNACIYTGETVCTEVCCDPHLGQCDGCLDYITASTSTDIAGLLFCTTCTEAYHAIDYHKETT